MATPTSRLLHGSPIAIDYTPGSAANAGDIVVQGDLLGLLPRDIAASVKGALQVIGPNAVFRVPKTAGTSAAITAGAVVYWNASSEVAQTTASTHKIMGKAVVAAADADTTVDVIGVQQATP